MDVTQQCTIIVIKYELEWINKEASPEVESRLGHKARCGGGARTRRNVARLFITHSIWRFSAPHSSLLRDTLCASRMDAEGSFAGRAAVAAQQPPPRHRPTAWDGPPSGMNGHALVLRGVIIVIVRWAELRFGLGFNCRNLELPSFRSWTCASHGCV